MALSKQKRRTALERARWSFQRQRRVNMLATPGSNDFIMVLDHVNSDFNIGKIFRSADAFGARELHLVGIDWFNPAPAMGSFKWVAAKFHHTFNACFNELSERGYSLFTLEPAQGEFLHEARLPKNSAFIVGHEENGISFDKADFPSVQALRIPQFGKVQSLNVSVAASIVMYEYARQNVFPNDS